MAQRPGRHGSMASSEVESIIARNGNFLTIIRAGSGDGQAGIYESVSGRYLGGLGGGHLPEYSRMTSLKYDCVCTPNGVCETGAHGTGLVRGWRNILYDLIMSRKIRDTRDMRRFLGDAAVDSAIYGYAYGSPQHDPNQMNRYASL